MNMHQREVIFLVFVFVCFIWFVWTNVASDLPDDFLSSARSKSIPKEEADGRLRDNG
jgi:hypothetical protein